jgi:hypothetical protein
MGYCIEVQFESVVLEEQRVCGRADDYLESTVHFSFQYPDGRVDAACSARVRHVLSGPDGGIVQVTVPAAFQCPDYLRLLEWAIGEYYREQVGDDGLVIRLGPKGASPLIVGVKRDAPGYAVFEVGIGDENG